MAKITFFSKNNCMQCKMTKKFLEQHNADFEEINIDEQPELASRFGVMSIPTLMVWKDGKLTDTSVGVKPKHMIEEMLR